MSETPAAAPAHSRDDPPWSHGGDQTAADWGAVFAWPAAGRAVMLSFDAKGASHALTLFDDHDLGAEIVVHGRRFEVRRADWRTTTTVR